jgi:hypothetical protein
VLFNTIRALALLKILKVQALSIKILQLYNSTILQYYWGRYALSVNQASYLLPFYCYTIYIDSPRNAYKFSL